jgi:hypothetical protein
VCKEATLAGKYDRTCWFHLTRTITANKFRQGILPLGQRLDAVWDFLYSVSDAMHWGPYALLIKDHAFKSEQIGNHDYFDSPEIVEDVCIYFTERHRFDLLAAFKNSTNLA